jgi:hypothetical protein
VNAEEAPNNSESLVERRSFDLLEATSAAFKDTEQIASRPIGPDLKIKRCPVVAMPFQKDIAVWQRRNQPRLDGFAHLWTYVCIDPEPEYERLEGGLGGGLTRPVAIPVGRKIKHCLKRGNDAFSRPWLDRCGGR